MDVAKRTATVVQAVNVRAVVTYLSMPKKMNIKILVVKKTPPWPPLALMTPQSVQMTYRQK